MIKVAPSILSCDFSELKEEIVKLEQAKVDYVHFDVMDNHFVPNLTFGPKFIKDMRKYTNLPFDVHLMIDEPIKSIDSFLDAGGDIYTFHIEALSDVYSLYNKVKEQNRKFALSVKPLTPIEAVYPYLSLVDMILIMTVEPGFGGQKLIVDTLSKISALKSELEKQGYKDVDIEVDGGINLDNIERIASYGANVFVMGSGFFKNADYVLFMDRLNSTLMHLS